MISVSREVITKDTEKGKTVTKQVVLRPPGWPNKDSIVVDVADLDLFIADLQKARDVLRDPTPRKGVHVYRGKNRQAPVTIVDTYFPLVSYIEGHHHIQATHQGNLYDALGVEAWTV